VTYLEWVERVLAAFVVMGSDTNHLNGIRELTAFMAIDGADDAIHTAIQDLDALGLLDASEINWIKEVQSTRMVREGTSVKRDLWPRIVGTGLDRDQAAFLSSLIDLSERPGETFADVDWVHAHEVYAALGWDERDRDPHALTKSLEEIALVRRHVTLGSLQAYPTYRGIVRTRERVNTEWWGRIVDMVDEWETTTVEFKERIPLGTEKTNAEFVHDVIALANTKASGRDRHIVIGWSDVNREFRTPFDASFDQDRIEQILNVYAAPAPQVRLVTLDHPDGLGQVAVIEVRRDPARVPHRMAHEGGKIRVGQVFVRHGSHVEEPTAAELADLEAEGVRARASM
jgi:hypothetical protein